MDWLIEDLKSRFSNDVLDQYKLNIYLPSNAVARQNMAIFSYTNNTDKDLKLIAKKYTNVHEVQEEEFKIKSKAEYNMWSFKWNSHLENRGEIPSSANETFAVCQPIMFPLIKSMLKILLTLPVRTARAEVVENIP